MSGVLFHELSSDCAVGPPEFWRLPSGVDVMLAEWSKAGPVAYVESEYFGGVGEENSAVWRDGCLALGPLHLLEGEPVAAQGSPVAQALRELGIRAAGSSDEFAAVGLDRHRASEDWIC
ncbi:MULTISPECIES: hypothetical protein [unclassified Streptomyces]|uniref:hypothetical protein n=1 Tax=unclassified Streptomyces TaxID=2593676 RepID=UPI002DDBCB86|nr:MULTISPECIES: hypothetical protein [unclassified Streptomyces]WSE00537.1 hypothetical protein OG758_44010 [Streptomyces sp. NBC_01474]